MKSADAITPALPVIPLAEHGVPPTLLCLEITESGFMDDPAHAQKVLERLSALGLKLSIDDYGTGYSSLSYIMKLPVQELKIDQSFIRHMVGNEDILSAAAAAPAAGQPAP